MLLLDSGNFSDNPTSVGDERTRALLEAMSKLGYAASNVGEREVVLGYDEFARRTQDASLEFVSTNIVKQDTKAPVFKPYTVVSVGDPPMRVGVLGVTRFNPLFLKSGPEASHMVIAPPTEMVRRYLDEVRRLSDVVVLLAAMSHDDARLLARDLPGVDLVIGSYGGYFSTQEVIEGSARVVYSGNQGQRVGEARIYLDPDRGGVAGATTYLHLLSVLYGEDPDWLEFAGDVSRRIGELRQARQEGLREIRETSQRKPFAGSNACGRCHEREYSQWEGTKHASAYTVLAKEGNHEKLACLICHATGSAEEGGFRSVEETPGLASVGCESCHGPGAQHVAAPRAGYGRTELTTCVRCHNRENSPEFDYYSYRPKVLHAESAVP